MKNTLAVEGEKGAVATIVAIAFSSLVVFSLLALVLDVGSMKYERRQLQNGADAAAMALANQCAQNAANCISGNPIVQTLVNKNATDGQPNNVDGVCGVIPTGGSFGACRTPSAADLRACPPLPAWVGTHPYVEVYAGTGNSATAKQPGIFSNVLGAGDNPHGTACARAAWGPAGNASVFPWAFSECEWNDAVTNVGYGVETAIAENYKKGGTPCDTYNGHNFTGGFGWLVHTATCVVDVDSNSWAEGDQGNGKGNDCLPSINVGDEILIPVYDCIDDNKNISVCSPSSHTFYHIKGLASFKVTAIDLTGKKIGTPGSDAKKECQNQSNNKQCVYGMYLKELVPVGTHFGSSDFGSSAVIPAG